jgi:hypothetical protein
MGVPVGSLKGERIKPMGLQLISFMDGSPIGATFIGCCFPQLTLFHILSEE